MDALIVSNALDTNGQNARYVKAARRYGRDRAVLKALAVGNTDPAGVVARFQVAADKLGDLSIRSAHRADQYFEFPHDIIWDRTTDREVRRLAGEADVLHLNNSYRPAQRLNVQKPMLLHHHGSLFRNNAAHMLAVAKSARMAQAVSTIDLLRPAPSVLHWLPTAYDVTALAEYGKANRREADGVVRVVHCPTNREIKSTNALIAAVDGLRADGLAVELVLVEGRPWTECMEIKATADILFDQVGLGYGCNAVEAWAMRIPVIAGADDWTLARMTSEWGRLPFYPATEATIAEAIRALVESPDLRAKWGERGYGHVAKYHDERPALTRLAELYHESIRLYSRDRLERAKVPAVTFRSSTNRPVAVAGRRIVFDKGLAAVDDPLEIDGLRDFIARRPRYGVSEVAAVKPTEGVA